MHHWGSKTHSPLYDFPLTKCITENGTIAQSALWDMMIQNFLGDARSTLNPKEFESYVSEITASCAGEAPSWLPAHSAFLPLIPESLKISLWQKVRINEKT